MMQTFAGRCVNTMVLIRPKRSATGTATSCDTAVQMLLQNRMAAIVLTDTPKC